MPEITDNQRQPPKRKVLYKKPKGSVSVNTQGQSAEAFLKRFEALVERFENTATTLVNLLGKNNPLPQVNILDLPLENVITLPSCTVRQQVMCTRLIHKLYAGKSKITGKLAGPVEINTTRDLLTWRPAQLKNVEGISAKLYELLTECLTRHGFTVGQLIG